jgi:hypothetical protein
MLANASECALCENGFYCTENTNERQSCPIGFISPQGSDTLQNCSCPPGTHPQASTCEACPENSFCPNGLRLECPEHSYSIIGSVNFSQCICRAGFMRSTLSAPISDPSSNDPELCLICESEGYWCDGSPHEHRCTARQCSTPEYLVECTDAADSRCEICPMPLHASMRTGENFSTVCEWECDHGYYKTLTPIAECTPCRSLECGTGFRESGCPRGSTEDNKCVECPQPPKYSRVVPAPHGETCGYACDEGFWKPGRDYADFCCSDFAYFVDIGNGVDTAHCECLPGWSGDGVDCIL